MTINGYNVIDENSLSSFLEKPIASNSIRKVKQVNFIIPGSIQYNQPKIKIPFKGYNSADDSIVFPIICWTLSGANISLVYAHNYTAAFQVVYISKIGGTVDVTISFNGSDFNNPYIHIQTNVAGLFIPWVMFGDTRNTGRLNEYYNMNFSVI